MLLERVGALEFRAAKKLQRMCAPRKHDAIRRMPLAMRPTRTGRGHRTEPRQLWVVHGGLERRVIESHVASQHAAPLPC